MSYFLTRKDHTNKITRKLLFAGSKTLTYCWFVAFLFLQACSGGPEPIHYGKDGCDFCKMIIVDSHFGAELVTSKGKIYKFDSIECMIHYFRQNSGLNIVSALMLVTDHSRPGEMIDARKAGYLVSEKLPSPMGASLSAFIHADSLHANLMRFGGQSMQWEELLHVIK